MPGTQLNYETDVVAASPANDSETVVAILQGVNSRYDSDWPKLYGWAQIVPDSATTAVVLRVRRSDIGGDSVGEPGGVTFDPAGTLTDLSVEVNADDVPGGIANATYVLTVECVDAGGPATVNAVKLSADVGS